MSAFRIHFSQAVLEDLRTRLERTRWPGRIQGVGWERGTDIDYLTDLVDHWRDGYDWRAREAELNRLPHLRVDVDGLGVHAIHQRSDDPAAVPLLLLHGWPDSFLRYAKVLPLLTDFHLVVPSHPGYGFSDHPARPGCSAGKIADVMARLMAILGYERFAVSGGDVGSGVAEWLSRRYPQRLVGLHLTDVPYWHLFELNPARLSEAEQAYLAAGQRWQMAEGAYALLQSTKPMTAAYGLTDSPVGLAAWIVEKLRAWSDCQGDLERRFTPDEVLTNVMIYWLTGTIGSSFTVYYEEDPSGDGDSRIDVPTGVAIFPADLVPAPRVFAERFFDLRRWTEMPRGGHFTAMEEPELFASDVRAFLTSLTTA